MTTRSPSRATQQRAARAVAAQQAAAHRARQRRRRVVLLAVGGVLAVAAVVGIIVGTASSRHTPGRALVPPGVTAAGGILVGSPSAPVKVIAYEDLQCPVCARFERGNGLVLSQAVKDGKVSVEYRLRSFLGVESVRAANALAAAQADGKFESLRETLYAHQPVERTGGYTTETLIGLGRDVGLTSSSYVAAVRGLSYESWVHRVDDQASRDGNVATPELRVNGRVLTQQELFDPKAFPALLGL